MNWNDSLYWYWRERGGEFFSSMVWRDSGILFLDMPMGPALIQCELVPGRSGIVHREIAITLRASMEHPYYLTVRRERFSGREDAGGCLDAEGAARRVVAGIDHLADRADDVVAVSIDTGRDGVRYDEGTEAYLDALARVNAELAAASACAVEVVCGLPVWLRGSMDVWKDGAR